MWLRRTVGVVMIITLIGMNIIAIIGLFEPAKKPAADLQSVSQPTTVNLTITPGKISTGNTATLSWTTTGNPDSCTASGSWSGVKTPFGSESSGRQKVVGKHTFTLTCNGKGGSSGAKVSLNVIKGVVTSQQSASSTSANTGGGATYCGGRIPCYNAKDVAAHGSKGNCWGWLGDRVINVSGFDVSFHAARSGVSTIELSSICGKDLTPAVSGRVPGDGYAGGHNHELGAKSNSDKNYLSYFVGYFDANKK